MPTGTHLTINLRCAWVRQTTDTGHKEADKMDFTLTEDQQAYVEVATAFANEALKPHAARWD